MFKVHSLQHFSCFLFMSYIIKQLSNHGFVFGLEMYIEQHELFLMKIMQVKSTLQYVPVWCVRLDRAGFLKGNANIS